LSDFIIFINIQKIDYYVLEIIFLYDKEGEMKKLFISIFLILLIILSFGCKEKETDKIDNNQLNQKKEIKVGLALGYGGVGDMGFNDLQYNGLIKASKDFNIDIAYKVPESNTEDAMEKIIQELINEKCNLIFVAGFLAVNPTYKLAELNKNIHFVVLDNSMDIKDNISSVIYAQHEGSFIVGYLAAEVSKTKKIGFIGGVDIPVIKAFETGFKEGIAYSGEKIDLSIEFCSRLPDFSGFDAAETGNRIANEMYQSGIDVIYAVAGATVPGIIESAKSNKKFVIGVDSNQDSLAEGYVLTSMMKRLDNSVYDLIKLFLDKKLENKVYVYNYSNNGVSITDMKYTRDKISNDIIQRIKEIEKDIAEGKIKVTDYLTQE